PAGKRQQNSQPLIRHELPSFPRATSLPKIKKGKPRPCPQFPVPSSMSPCPHVSLSPCLGVPLSLALPSPLPASTAATLPSGKRTPNPQPIATRQLTSTHFPLPTKKTKKGSAAESY